MLNALPTGSDAVMKPYTPLDLEQLLANTRVIKAKCSHLTLYEATTSTSLINGARHGYPAPEYVMQCFIAI